MRKRVLFLTAFLPHPGAAAEKNTMMMLEDLSREYDIDLVYFKYKKEKEYIAPNNHIFVKRSFNNSIVRKLLNIFCFPFVHPLFSVRFNWGVLCYLKTLVSENHYNAIILDHSQMFLYGKYIKSDIPKILLSHDVIAQRVGRNSNALIKWICKKSERKALTVQNGFVFSFSQKDCDLIKSTYSINARLCLDYIDPYIIGAIPEDYNNEFVFIGKWTREDNLDGVIWFYKTIVPRITKPVIINIVGKNFPKEKISCKNPMVSTNILGFVDNPYPLIAKSRAMIAPLFTGAGIKVKVIEALACGTPVIGTEIAFEGLPEKYSNMMKLANDVDSYLKAMEVDIPVEERRRIKKEFIADYTSETIPQFLNSILKK